MHLQRAFSCIIKCYWCYIFCEYCHRTLEYLFIRYAVISSPSILSRSTDTWDMHYLVRVVPTIPYLRPYGKLRMDVKLAPESQEGKTVFVYDYSAVLIAG